MYSKMALANVRKSIRDYTIYFYTLTFGVCLFYVFNSLGSQKSVMVLSSRQNGLMEMLEMIMSSLSVFVSFILGFLIIYANSFLIKRRKKELGIYLLQGMEKWQMSAILIQETVFIGIFSLITGLIVGIGLSQGLSILTAKMFLVELEEFHFIFSKTAFIKSIIYFGLIYIIVIIFNSISISRYKLIDLINAEKRTEKLKVKNMRLAGILFVISVGCIAAAYYQIEKNGLTQLDNHLMLSIILGAAGTFLFFFSLSGILLRLMKSHKRMYYGGLNMFVVNQVNAKVTTTFISMSVICLLLFLSIGILSTGGGMAVTMNREAEQLMPYDASIMKYADENKGTGFSGREYAQILEQWLEEEQIPGREHIQLIESYAVYILPGFTGEELFRFAEDNPDLAKEFRDNLLTETVTCVKLSDYNMVIESQGKKKLDLANNGGAILSSVEQMYGIYEKFFEDSGSLEVNGQTVQLLPQILDTSIENSPFRTEIGVMILPDELLENAEEYKYVANILYKMDKETETAFIAAADAVEKEDNPIYDNTIVKTDMYEQQAGLKAVLTYIAIYLGIVFLISCSAILALQQLSESSDNIQRYQLLRKLGVDEKEINKSLLQQMCISFLMPLILAVIHAIVGIRVVNRVVSLVGMDAGTGIITSAIGILIIYGGYLLVTYMTGKRIIRER